MKCLTLHSLLEGDFEPRNFHPVRCLHATETHVIPNIEGVFLITLLNVTTSDIHLKSGKVMGSIHLINESIANVSESNRHRVDNSDISIGNKLSDSQRKKLT